MVSKMGCRVKGREGLLWSYEKSDIFLCWWEWSVREEKNWCWSKALQQGRGNVTYSQVEVSRDRPAASRRIGREIQVGWLFDGEKLRKFYSDWFYYLQWNKKQSDQSTKNGVFWKFWDKRWSIKWSLKLKEFRDQDSMVEFPEKTEGLG